MPCDDNRNEKNCNPKFRDTDGGLSGIGHNSGADCSGLRPDEIEAIEASWLNATLPARIILAYCEAKAPAFKPGQSHSDLPQNAILQNALLRCLVVMARVDKGMDLRPVLLALIGAFSANRHWQSSVSATRLARLLNRSERTIRRWLTDLVLEKRIIRVERAGFSTTYALPIVELDATSAISPTVILDALAPKEGGRWGRGHWEPNETNPGPILAPDSMVTGATNLAPVTNCDSPGHTGCPPNKDSNQHITGSALFEIAGQTSDHFEANDQRSRPCGAKQKQQLDPISAWDKADPPGGYTFERGVFVDGVGVASECLGIIRFDDMARQIQAKLPAGSQVINAADIREAVIDRVVQDAVNRKAGVHAAALDPRYAASNIASNIARSYAEAKRNASTANGYRHKTAFAGTSNTGHAQCSPEALAAAMSDHEWRSALTLFTKTDRWTAPGQPPGKHGCLVPAHLIDAGVSP